MKMRVVDLEFRYPKNVAGIAADPEPDWSFDALLSELNSLENRLHAVSNVASSFNKSQARDKNGHTAGFVMHFSDSERDTETDSEEEEDRDHGKLTVGRRYTFDEGTLSEVEDFEENLGLGDCNSLMDATGYVEGSLCELLHDQQINIAEEIRSQIIELESELVEENEKFISKLASAEKYVETKWETERNQAMQYQRNIAEALDNHLTTVQRNHEQKSQIEEKRIRDDAIREEAHRKEKTQREEELRQERIKAEAEMQARLIAERDKAAQAAAKEASRKAANEAAEKEASEHRKKAEAAGALIKSTETALKLANSRLKVYAEVAERNDVLLRSASNTDYQKHEKTIARTIRQISGSVENVWAKADALVKLISDPSYPQSISISMFTKKFVSCCENSTGSFNRSVYAYGQVIVLVTSKVPIAMDILIAELNRICIYTVPKHLSYSKTAYESTNAYYKGLGYREEEGKIEDHDTFLERLSSYMKLYGALVQTEVPETRNLHGITEGWAWLARFLNALPPNIYTAVALESFLQMAGFTLYRKYKSQFIKMLHIIDRDFLSGLSKLKDEPRLAKRIANIRNYLDTKQFLKKPEGWQLEEFIESHNFKESNNSNEPNHFNSSNQFNNSSYYFGR